MHTTDGKFVPDWQALQPKSRGPNKLSTEIPGANTKALFGYSSLWYLLEDALQQLPTMNVKPIQSVRDVALYTPPKPCTICSIQGIPSSPYVKPYTGPTLQNWVWWLGVIDLSSLGRPGVAINGALLF